MGLCDPDSAPLSCGRAADAGLVGGASSQAVRKETVEAESGSRGVSQRVMSLPAAEETLAELRGSFSSWRREEEEREEECHEGDAQSERLIWLVVGWFTGA